MSNKYCEKSITNKCPWRFKTLENKGFRGLRVIESRMKVKGYCNNVDLKLSAKIKIIEVPLNIWKYKMDSDIMKSNKNTSFYWLRHSLFVSSFFPTCVWSLNWWMRSRKAASPRYPWGGREFLLYKLVFLSCLFWITSCC